MSKLEKAIRRASERHDVNRSRRTEGATLEGEVTETGSRLAPVLYRLQAQCHHTPTLAHLSKNRIVHPGYPETALASYKMLRTKVLQALDTNDWKTLAITAPNHGAGKTLTAINLAITLASHGDHDIFLVDMDLRNPSIAELFDLPEELAGITAYLDLGADLTSVLWSVGIDNLAVLANRDRIRASSELITSRKMRELISTFRHGAPRPIIIFDLPPILTTDDAVAISPYMDAILVVASERETERDSLYQSLDLLSGKNVLGVVLNKASTSR